MALTKSQLESAIRSAEQSLARKEAERQSQLEIEANRSAGVNQWDSTLERIESDIARRQRELADLRRRLSELNSAENPLPETDPSQPASQDEAEQVESGGGAVTSPADIDNEVIVGEDLPADRPVDGAIPFPSEPGQVDDSPLDGPVEGAIPFPSEPGQAPDADPSLPPSEQLAREENPEFDSELDPETIQGVDAQRAGRNPADIDWRVKLSLAPQADYLYNSSNPGILEPLKATNGVIFPYTPQIDTVYHATYNNQDLVHSNYRGYFYQNSYLGEILMQATFTAQTSREADYLLAVIHFFRSATKTFYGQDDQRGTPPPLLYLSGFGEHQFNQHPCVLTQFNYNFPKDVDYIRAAAPSRFNPPQPSDPPQEENFWTKTAASLLGEFDGAAARLAASALSPGAPAETLSTTPGEISEFISQDRIASTIQRPTYVPTEISMSLTLLPMQSRKQVSEEFSLSAFASGKLLRKGFW